MIKNIIVKIKKHRYPVIFIGYGVLCLLLNIYVIKTYNVYNAERKNVNMDFIFHAAFSVIYVVIIGAEKIDNVKKILMYLLGNLTAYIIYAVVRFIIFFGFYGAKYKSISTGSEIIWHLLLIIGFISTDLVYLVFYSYLRNKKAVIIVCWLWNYLYFIIRNYTWNTHIYPYADFFIKPNNLKYFYLEQLEYLQNINNPPTDLVGGIDGIGGGVFSDHGYLYFGEGKFEAATYLIVMGLTIFLSIILYLYKSKRRS